MPISMPKHDEFYCRMQLEVFTKIKSEELVDWTENDLRFVLSRDKTGDKCKQ